MFLPMDLLFAAAGVKSITQTRPTIGFGIIQHFPRDFAGLMLEMS